MERARFRGVSHSAVIAGCGIQQRGPFFSEILAFNMKMEEILEGQRELLCLSPRGAVTVGSSCHACVAKAILSNLY